MPSALDYGFLDLGNNMLFHIYTAIALGRTAILILIGLTEDSHLSTHQKRSLRRAGGAFLVAKLFTVAQGIGRLDANTIVDG
jgi:hypothetical protein